ncbi:membrane protein [Lentzea sp. NBRC 105346]|uniref:nuclear transport factor 2 family protein n=1 Tax=Lentzea sp. NBRC 105346 TaxID=3032205 RepID=UPI0024A36CE9|nr:nuclear transport factor 2 family protein [Lentzea sp. NBRC 105346]GLZ29223.1 membrane protein [Lentzea sp. NBRC 105346]
MTNQLPAAFELAAVTADLPAIERLLADDAVLRSPVMPKPYRGREAVMELLKALSIALDEIRYPEPPMADEAGGRYALQFEAVVDGKVVHGMDVLTVRDGLIREITVYARPMPALMSLARAVGQAAGAVR